jgi:hypothetical protein
MVHPCQHVEASINLSITAATALAAAATALAAEQVLEPDLVLEPRGCRSRIVERRELSKPEAAAIADLNP